MGLKIIANSMGILSSDFTFKTKIHYTLLKDIPLVIIVIILLHFYFDETFDDMFSNYFIYAASLFILLWIIFGYLVTYKALANTDELDNYEKIA